MLLELADLLGASFDRRPPAGALTWTSLVLCLAAVGPAVWRNSAISAMIAALAGAIAVLAGANWLLGVDSLSPATGGCCSPSPSATRSSRSCCAGRRRAMRS